MALKRFHPDVVRLALVITAEIDGVFTATTSRAREVSAHKF